MNQTITIIPARYSSTRFPGKPLVEIAGKPMIIRVYEQAKNANLGKIIVATDDERILSVVQNYGGEVILTSEQHSSGTDRIYEAITKIDPEGNFDQILNLQGDIPLIESRAIQCCFEPLKDPAVDLATIATEISDNCQRDDPNFVKAIGTQIDRTRYRALYFTRATAPSGDGPLFLHIGLYAYRRATLERFVSLPQSKLEIREKLEQLRAIEDGMRIDFSLIDSKPIDVNTQDDVNELEKLLAK